MERTERVYISVTPEVMEQLEEASQHRKDRDGRKSRPSLSGAAADVLEYFFASNDSVAYHDVFDS